MKLLRRKTTRPEGHPQGFSAAVYKALREVVFPFFQVELDHDREVLAWQEEEAVDPREEHLPAEEDALPLLLEDLPPVAPVVPLGEQQKG